jgi:hypothetical protein
MALRSVAAIVVLPARVGEGGRRLAHFMEDPDPCREMGPSTEGMTGEGGALCEFEGNTPSCQHPRIGLWRKIPAHLSSFPRTLSGSGACSSPGRAIIPTGIAGPRRSPSHQPPQSQFPSRACPIGWAKAANAPNMERVGGIRSGDVGEGGPVCPLCRECLLPIGHLPSFGGRSTSSPIAHAPVLGSYAFGDRNGARLVARVGPDELVGGRMM